MEGHKWKPDTCWFDQVKVETDMKEELLKKVKEELKKKPVVIEREVSEDVKAFLCRDTNITIPTISDYDLFEVPTWALIEELKKRPGVVYRANATDKGLVGWFEHAPAIILGVKLPVNDEV
jgi:hypothetical protein